MESEAKRLYDFVLTRFLDANRYPSSGQARGHASLENAIDCKNRLQKSKGSPTGAFFVCGEARVTGLRESRHCERSEAIQKRQRKSWIASSAVPPRNDETALSA
jgi:hypothetical protein